MMFKMLMNKVVVILVELESMVLGDSKLFVVVIVSKIEKYKISVFSKVNDVDVDSVIKEVLLGEFFIGLIIIIFGVFNVILGDILVGEMEK